MGATDRLLDALKNMMELNVEFKHLSKRVDKMDDALNDHVQRIVRIETFIEIAEKQKLLKKK